LSSSWLCAYGFGANGLVFTGKRAAWLNSIVCVCPTCIEQGARVAPKAGRR
jgi:hypothetical protein